MSTKRNAMSTNPPEPTFRSGSIEFGLLVEKWGSASAVSLEPAPSSSFDRLIAAAPEGSSRWRMTLVSPVDTAV